MIKLKKSDWIARLLHDANEVPHRCCFNENQITKRFRAGFSQLLRCSATLVKKTP